jgi:capsular exopolysaccharide synthesis family protein
MGNFNIQNINIPILLRDILRNLWLIVIVGLIGFMLTYAYIKGSYQPEYTSSSIYVVAQRQNTSIAGTNQKFAENVVNLIQNLANSEIMRKRVKEDLHRTVFDASVTAEQIPGTNLMRLSVTSSSPVDAFNMIGAIMDNYAELSDYLISNAVFEPMRAPTISTFPDNALTPRKKSVTAGLIAALITLVLVAIASILRKTIKTESQIIDTFDTNVLGTVRHEIKNKTLKARLAKSVKGLLITSPIISARFVDSINNIRIKLEYEHERHPEKNVFMITSVCENEGKSTISINTALSLARDGNRVIVIDADLRKPAIYKMLDIPKRNFVDYQKLLLGECGMDKVFYREKKLGLDLIMASKGHSGTHELMKSGAMMDLINRCSRMADYVILDTPPMAMVSDAEALVDRVDFSILVVRQDRAFQRDVTTSINTLKDADSKFLGCVLNDYRTIDFKARRIYYPEEKAVEVYGG